MQLIQQVPACANIRAKGQDLEKAVKSGSGEVFWLAVDFDDAIHWCVHCASTVCTLVCVSTVYSLCLCSHFVSDVHVLCIYCASTVHALCLTFTGIRWVIFDEKCKEQHVAPAHKSNIRKLICASFSEGRELFEASLPGVMRAMHQYPQLSNWYKSFAESSSKVYGFLALTREMVGLPLVTDIYAQKSENSNKVHCVLN